MARDPFGRRFVERGRRRAGQLDGIGGRQGLEAERERVGEAAAPPRPGLEHLVAAGADQERGKPPATRRDLFDELKQLRTRELELIERDHDRARGGEPLQEGHEARTHHRDAIGPVALLLGRQTQRELQAGGGRLDLLGPADLLERRTQQFSLVVRRRRLGRADLAADHLRDRSEGRVLFEAAHPTAQHLDVDERFQELVDEPRLADPRLAEHRHQVQPRRLARPRERLVQQRHLATASDERDRAPGAPLGQSFHRPRDDRLHEPLRLDRARRTERDRPLGELARRLSGEDLAGRRRLLKSRGEVHRRAGHQ